MIAPQDCSPKSIADAVVAEQGYTGDKETVAREATQLAIEWSRIVGMAKWTEQPDEKELKKSCYQYIIDNHSMNPKKAKQGVSKWFTIPLAMVTFFFFSNLVWVVAGVLVAWWLIDSVAREKVMSGKP